MPDSLSQTFWGNACQAAFSAPEQTKVLKVQVVGGVSVSQPLVSLAYHDVDFSMPRFQLLV
jgi:hypothetical protein